MTKEEILKATSWDDYDMGVCIIFVPLFGKEIPFIFFQDHSPEPSISDKMTASVNDVLALTKSCIETLKDMLWEECIFAFTVTDYGFEPTDRETELEANFKGFKIANKEDAYAKSKVKEIHINQENDGLSGRYAEIKIHSASDNLISIIVKNGKLIDWDDDGCTLSIFDEDEQSAKRRREKTLQQ